MLAGLTSILHKIFRLDRYMLSTDSQIDINIFTDFMREFSIVVQRSCWVIITINQLICGPWDASFSNLQQAICSLIQRVERIMVEMKVRTVKYCILHNFL